MCICNYKIIFEDCHGINGNMSDPFRISEVPYEKDLDKIDRELNRRQEREEYRVVRDLKESDLLSYSVDKERHRRKNILDYNEFGLGDKYIQGFSTAAAGSLATIQFGEWSSVFMTSAIAYAATDYVIRKSNEISEDPMDSKMEEAIREYKENF